MTTGKFRGKGIITGVWIEGYLVIVDNKSCIFSGNSITGGLYPVFERAEVDPETVGEFSSYGDCTGTRIFEGDIIAIPDYWETPPDFWEAIGVETKWNNWEVVFKDGMFTVGGDIGDHPNLQKGDLSQESNNLGSIINLVGGRVKVVGNKFDNPELLK